MTDQIQMVLQVAESGRALLDATHAVLLWLDYQAGLFQTVTGSLAKLPGWLQAAGWGVLSASGLLIGTVGGYYTSLQHTAISRVMTFASGVLLAVVAVDLVLNARGAASLDWAVMGMLCGAAVFSGSVPNRAGRAVGEGQGWSGVRSAQRDEASHQQAERGACEQDGLGRHRGWRESHRARRPRDGRASGERRFSQADSS